MALRNLTIALRAGLGFGLVALLVLVLGGFALLKMADMRAESNRVEDNWLPSLITLDQIGQNVQRVRALTLRLLVNRDDQAVQANTAKLVDLKAQVRDSLREYAGLISSPQERVLYERFEQAEAAYMEQQGKIMDLVRQQQFDEAVAITNGVLNQHADDMSKALNELTTLNDKGAKASAALADKAYGIARTGVISVMLVAALLTISLATLLTRSIVLPLNEAVKVAERVASGNLAAFIEVSGQDEPARLLAALKTMQQSLRDTIMGISESSNQLASASEELSAVTEDANRGLHQQSNEIEQAATAVNQMTAAVEEVARNAVSTSEASRQSDRTAQQGREQVLKTVDSISHLADDVTSTACQVEQLAGQMRDISKVLDVIRSVAEQTNLLALNAAIEAARAGDAGRGFAVVADEVRGLAHRTQQSTQEIEQMIGSIQQGTDQAVAAMQNSNSRARSTLDVAQTAGQALDRIATAFTEINERNLVIASASEQQAQVAREVDRNLVNIRDLSMQTSAGANQTSAASQELSRLAVALNTMVSRFSV
ncbi:methyl-accepting chemotaxis protein [Pseudomonas sp. LS44]|uniref:methyl-accepting chemotaxis protein n=1 Tax=Pseudomonas sp. LS44 TaxID=1357074 RepID=UPI00215A3D3F|nr:methyl-accepting chemotaxis protein [Pseudomonas sp. LS44]UVE19264.1 methyl-accepting chemotaxis protein [Pseudomonas sp. LS44]